MRAVRGKARDVAERLGRRGERHSGPRAGEKKTMTLEMRNIVTGKCCPVHWIGKAEDGRDVYQAVDGWELVSDDRFDRELDCERDIDGNYLVIN